MPQAYKFSLITPRGKIVEQDIDSLVAPGVLGFFGILANHAPMMTMISPGVLKFKDNVKERFFALGSGILEVTLKSNVLLLADRAEESSSLKEAKQKAETIKHE